MFVYAKEVLARVPRTMEFAEKWRLMGANSPTLDPYDINDPEKLGRSPTVVLENGETSQLAVDGEGPKERLEREKMLRLQEAEQYMAASQDLVQLKPP
ncbi:hypothetical protein MMC22_002340 [Lobaria immixta]|nr:hypothetical protein [Lobaria immixta]